MHKFYLSCLFLLILCCLPVGLYAQAQKEQTAVSAEDKEAMAKKQAMADYKQGSKAFQDKDFDQALLLFTKAYRVIKNPIMVYNIARCFEEKRDFKTAANFYREYLNVAQNSDDKLEILLTINVLEGLDKPKVDIGMSSTQLWGWSSVSVGALFLIGGILTGIEVVDQSDQMSKFASQGNLSGYQSLQNDRNQMALLSDGLYLGSIALTSVGVYLLIQAFSDPKANYRSAQEGMKPIAQDGFPFSFSF